MSIQEATPEPRRGRLVDIGGRRLRVVPAGPVGQDSPTVLFEAGAFGFSADWSVVQERLAAAGAASLAYDRAGLGLSDPGPEPRDGAAILADLERLLERLGERGPFLLCGHSMAGLHVRLFAGRHRPAVAGAVLVEATLPEEMDSRFAAGLVGQLARASHLAAWSADSGLLKPLSRSGIGDAIGLSGEAKKEKLWAFSSARHNRWAAAEVDEWGRTAGQAREAGLFDRDLPLAVVLAGAGRRAARWKDHLAQPALAAQVGRVDRVKGANHASILGRRHADAVVEAIGWVRAARRP